MLRPPIAVELRKHPRALLNLPVRLRWRGPFGTRLETTHTVDVSRQGLLVVRAEPCEVRMRVWVAFPFEREEFTAVQPETLATVVRVAGESSGSFRVALLLETPARQPGRAPGSEHRKYARIPFALPIFVRPVGTPWPEESMTRDISRSGVRFEASHIYETGQDVLAKLPWGDWAEAGEIPGRIVRTGMVEEQPPASFSADADTSANAIITSAAIEWTRLKKL